MRALVIALISIALMMLDRRVDGFHRVSEKIAAFIAYPFQLVIDTPIQWVRWINTRVTTQRHLIVENSELKAYEVLLESQLQRLLLLEKENAQLRQLLRSSVQVPSPVRVARLLSVSLNPNLLQIVLDQGTKDHVFIGQPVFDAYGVMGEVVGVGPMTSRVLLITDTRSAIPVKDSRNGFRAVAVGLGTKGQLMLINFPNTADIREGDIFITSGFGLNFPVGYPVGQVTSITVESGQQNKKIILTPFAHLDQDEQALLAWPNKSKLYQAVQDQLKQQTPEAPVIPTGQLG